MMVIRDSVGRLEIKEHENVEDTNYKRTLRWLLGETPFAYGGTYLPKLIRWTGITARVVKCPKLMTYPDAIVWL